MKKFSIVSISVMSSCFGMGSPCESIRVINNTNLSVHAQYDVPIYSRADTKIQPIKSQQELQDLLYEAILTNSTQAIMQVVHAGADVNLFKDGKAPLMWATIHKMFNAVEVLKKCGAVNVSAENMLYKAIIEDSSEKVFYAVQAGANLNREINGKLPLVWAVVLCKHNAVDALCVCKADVNMYYSGQMLVNSASIASSSQHGFYATQHNSISYVPIKLLACALLLGDIKTALILIKHGADIKIPINHTIDVLVYVLQCINPAGEEDIVLELIQELFKRGYPLNSNGLAIIDNRVISHVSVWEAALKGSFQSTKVLELFMKNGANPNQMIGGAGGANWTPLFLAIQTNNPQIVAYLLSIGADVNQKAAPGGQNNYQTPLTYAMSLKHLDNKELIDILRQHGARA